MEGGCSEEHLAQAVDNLEYFSVVLITDSSLEYRWGPSALHEYWIGRDLVVANVQPTGKRLQTSLMRA